MDGETALEGEETGILNNIWLLFVRSQPSFNERIFFFSFQVSGTHFSIIPSPVRELYSLGKTWCAEELEVVLMCPGYKLGTIISQIP